MTSKTISGSITHGVTLNVGYPFNPLYVTGTINTAAGDGVQGDNTQAWTIDNTGTIEAAAGDGVNLAAGGNVTNGAGGAVSALISGFADGIYIHGTLGTVANFATIIGGNNAGDAGVKLTSGGTVTNGASSAVAALIQGYDAIFIEAKNGSDYTASVTNLGTLLGLNGVIVFDGGSVTNGAGARIAASDNLGIDITNNPGTVVNLGTVVAKANAVQIDGGSLANGSKSVTTALISSTAGIGFYNATLSLHLTNYGTIITTGAAQAAIQNTNARATIDNFGLVSASSGPGMLLYRGGGTVTNGASGVGTALITGAAFGVEVTGTSSATIINLASIEGTGSAGIGVYLAAGGSVGNGASGAGKALIEGAIYGVEIKGSSGTVSNFGTIAATSTSVGVGEGVSLRAGGNVSNGASGATAGLIEGGHFGLYITGGSGTVANFGSIESTGGFGIGVYLTAGGSVKNGASGSTAGVITGVHFGILISGSSGTIANFGTIEGTGSVGIGVYLAPGGLVTNGASGSGAALIEGGGGGVRLVGTGGTVVNFGTIAGTAGAAAILFDTAGDVLMIEPGSVLSGALAGFQRGDTIDLVGQKATGLVYSGTNTAGALTALDGTATVASVALSGFFVQSQFAFSSDGKGGTDITMHGTVYTGSYLQINLTNPATQNPAVIAPTGQVEDQSAPAVYGAAGFAWTLFNYGRIQGGGPLPTEYTGVVLADGGMITNGAATATSAYIFGWKDGVDIRTAAGTVVNFGTVSGLYNGILLYDGGSVSNGARGSTSAFIKNIFVEKAAGVIANFATVADGVTLTAGGSVSNGASRSNNALIKGYYFGFEISGSAGTVANFGSIEGTATLGVGVYLGAGGTLVNAGMISGNSGTAVSFGGTGGNRLVLDPGYHLGGIVVGSGSATNTLELGSATSAGTVTAVLATEFVNFGTVTVDPGARWTLAGSSSLAGITLTDLGTLSNTGTLSGAGSFIVDPATLFNKGSIGLTVTLAGGGYLDNTATGTIAAPGDGVFGSLGAATVVNAGAISGASGTAVSFGGIGGNRLVLDPGYYLGGAAVGSTSAGATNTLELGSTAGIGTLTGLGSSFVNFGTVTVDAGARWVLGGSNTIGAGATLSTVGTLTDAGTLVDAGTIIGNSRLIVASGGAEFILSGGTTRGTVLSGGSEFVLSGGSASGSTVTSGGRQYVSAGGVASGATIKAGGSQIVFSGGAARGTVVSGGNETASAGGVASGGRVASGGIERVYGRASAGTVASGGKQIVESGGVASGVTVKHGGSQTVYSGGVTHGTVLSGGVESVRGIASGGTVDSGGTETVYGRASSGVINGGLFEVASGGTASGTVTFVSGGTLQLDAGARFTGVLKGFGKPGLLDRIDLRGVTFTLGATTESFAQTTSTSGILTVTSGTHTVHVTLLGVYATSDFKLATDNHDGTRITDPPVAGGGASQTTFANIAPAGLPSGAADARNPPSYLPGALGSNEQAYAGQALLATGPPLEPGGSGHNPPLAVPR